MSRDLQQLLFEYCQIYYITMDFYNIYFLLLESSRMFAIPKTPFHTSHSGRKHGAKSFSTFTIQTKQIHIAVGERQQIFQEVETSQKK